MKWKIFNLTNNIANWCLIHSFDYKYLTFFNIKNNIYQYFLKKKLDVVNTDNLL